ncbi:AlpA family phage regulatory protein [Belnapia sp. T18]|uniref:AlpA family phage regulatory protein n=1 Tax=Belnapia arida TaxID=2804533 RepID=A0ABS1U6C1_9PROT|nr:AlpA family phage regulatory protein [Belnapia arida]
MRPINHDRRLLGPSMIRTPPFTPAANSFGGNSAPLIASDREVARLLGCARATVWRAVHTDDSFPRPVRLLGRRVGWRISEIEAWLAAREPAH